ncbi:globin domain-containing protein [Aeromonas sp. BIGb0445]|uniref:globin domain-containing protein n=1 Tax=Aeromonas sp. BIGb0445 TaxID=2940593 RepID=UPI0021670F47|nr:globin domain-containing protein [Aeromonas sp. BIGb0445]MCS3459813.1 hemoglobin-like flavoprotein [Aeromonas sp. BIGb0445]
MTSDDIDLVQRAWSRISLFSNDFVREIYQELFILDPGLVPMFTMTNEQLVSKVSQTLNIVLTSLEQLDALRFIIRHLGQQHRRYGVTSEHFALVKLAMTNVMAKRLGEHFTPALALAWSSAYDEIAAIMIEGLQAEQPCKEGAGMDIS